MQRRIVLGSVAAAIALVWAAGTSLQAQEGPIRLPGDDTVRPWGQGAAPIYEGWYEHPDNDSLVISFGYLNRNSQEVLDIPIGESNHMEPESLNGIQPTHFLPRRHYGWFTVTVPPEFRENRDEVVWTIDFRGTEYSIPGRASNINYLIDAMQSPGTGLTPPALRFERDGEEARGPHGIRGEPLTATVGEPLELEVWTADDTWSGDVEFAGEMLEPHEVDIRWYKFRGPGGVSFGNDQIEVQPTDGLARAVTSVTFSEPGEYVLYARANNESLTGAGQEQCCWTNAYVEVNVE